MARTRWLNARDSFVFWIELKGWRAARFFAGRLLTTSSFIGHVYSLRRLLIVVGLLGCCGGGGGVALEDLPLGEAS